MYDDELVERATKAVHDIGLLVWTGSMDDARRVALVALDAVSEYLAEQGPNIEGDWWTEGPREGEA